jgi:hypothetical protein
MVKFFLVDIQKIYTFAPSFFVAKLGSSFLKKDFIDIF